MERIVRSLREKQRRIREELSQRTLGYLLAAFGFVASLAWNDAIKSFIETIFPTSSNSVAAKFLYACIVTVFVVVATLFFVKVLEKPGETKK